MSASSFTSLVPPLPPGWSEHIGPGGQPYYHNAQTQESTYVRPIPAFPIEPIAQSESPKKKERPLTKTPIPGTEWLRVKTTEGNIFYSHKTKKESVWVVPDEIKEALKKSEKDESRRGDRNVRDITQDEHERSMEVQKVKEEVQQALVKRKAEQKLPLDEAIAKKPRIEEDEEEHMGESSESEEEDWQREAAAQLEAEAETEKVRQQEEEARLKEVEAEAEAKRTQLDMPKRVDLSIEEAKALFKNLLREQDINPLHPWDMSLPKFISDPRYVLLPSVSVRREAFDEYCRDRARELRQTAVKDEKGGISAKDDFERLLHEEIKSTRTTWSEYRRTWKKDRAFYGWGRDDREREKRFREYIKELGEKKRVQAQKAEADFFTMLRDGKIAEGSVWKDVKRQFYDDPRYDVVGSSSLREELFGAFMKGINSKATPELEIMALAPQKDVDKEGRGSDEDFPQKNRKGKQDQAIKEREQRVKFERDRLEADIGRSRFDVNREEGERDFKSMLTDAIRDPQATWDSALPQLKTDPRFRNSPLSPNQQLQLFHAHAQYLRSKHLEGLYALFEAHAPTLAVQFKEIPFSSLISSPPVIKLGYDIKSLEQAFRGWQQQRTQESKMAFDEMLAENSFVEFWGRLGKIGGEGVDGGVRPDDLGDDQGEGGGGTVDMKLLAKNVDIGDMERVLKNDKRYIMFNHVPEQRERWLRDYLSNLSAPQLSVHIQQT